ncbi:MAG: hypothetical protein FJ271_12140 [Planctomycetes bacterium]|nr:hypothetical protein [Planctomycetota bacterium]
MTCKRQIQRLALALAPIVFFGLFLPDVVGSQESLVTYLPPVTDGLEFAVMIFMILWTRDFLVYRQREERELFVATHKQSTS